MDPEKCTYSNGGGSNRPSQKKLSAGGQKTSTQNRPKKKSGCCISILNIFGPVVCMLLLYVAADYGYECVVWINKTGSISDEYYFDSECETRLTQRIQSKEYGIWRVEGQGNKTALALHLGEIKHLKSVLEQQHQAFDTGVHINSAFLTFLYGFLCTLLALIGLFVFVLSHLITDDGFCAAFACALVLFTLSIIRCMQPTSCVV